MALQWGVLLVVHCACVATQAIAASTSIECGNLQGARVDFFTSQYVESKSRHRRLIENDGISGLVARVTWTDADRDAVMLTADNINDTGGLARYTLYKLQSEPFVVLVGRQEAREADDAWILLSYYPSTKKLVWSSHQSRFLMFEGGSHGKLYMADCRLL